MSIRIFVTGGTFDKEYNELEGKLYFKDTHVREMLRLGRADLDLEIQSWDLSLDAEKRTDSYHCGGVLARNPATGMMKHGRQAQVDAVDQDFRLAFGAPRAPHHQRRQEHEPVDDHE